jgi:RNA polymerase-binding transcription factor DksA
VAADPQNATDAVNNRLRGGAGRLILMDADEARRRLEAERARLTQVKDDFDVEHLADESEGESLSELSSVDQHQADVGTETFEREKDLSILEQVDAELSDVERALQRLDDGTYGTCEFDGKPIPEARLEAMPAARFCVEHQTEAERQAARARPE